MTSSDIFFCFAHHVGEIKACSIGLYGVSFTSGKSGHAYEDFLATSRWIDPSTWTKRASLSINGCGFCQSRSWIIFLDLVLQLRLVPNGLTYIISTEKTHRASISEYFSFIVLMTLVYLEFSIFSSDFWNILSGLERSSVWLGSASVIDFLMSLWELVELVSSRKSLKVVKRTN